MPRAKLDTAFLGRYTLTALDCACVKDAGWLVKALTAWILRDQEPDPAAIQPHLAPLWTIIHDESVAIHEARKQQAEAGRKGGKANGKQTASEPEANGKQKVTKMEMEKENISSDVRCPDVARERASRPSSVGVGHRPSVDSSIRIPSPSEDFAAWAHIQDDPVDVAMCATGETDKRARRTYGAQLKRLGRERFVELVCDFRSTLADEPPRNKGATLTAFLRDTP